VSVFNPDPHLTHLNCPETFRFALSRGTAYSSAPDFIRYAIVTKHQLQWYDSNSVTILPRFQRQTHILFTSIIRLTAQSQVYDKADLKLKTCKVKRAHVLRIRKIDVFYEIIGESASPTYCIKSVLKTIIISCSM